MPDTLLLDRTTWDLVRDSSGNIALASAPYELAQDAASAIKTFPGELWYDTSQGVPYGQILGKTPSVQALKAQIVKAALTVPGIIAARCYVSSVAGRVATGQVHVTDKAGNVSVAGF